MYERRMILHELSSNMNGYNTSFRNDFYIIKLASISLKSLSE